MRGAGSHDSLRPSPLSSRWARCNSHVGLLRPFPGPRQSTKSWEADQALALLDEAKRKQILVCKGPDVGKLPRRPIALRP